MGKIIISDNVSLDGVIQDPAGGEGFRHGGWVGRPAAREETAQVLLDEALGTQALLFGRYTGCDWYAREEYRHAPTLGDITSREGLILLPPYKTGVVLLTAELAHPLVTLLDDFVWYAWRLLLGICLWRPQVDSQLRV